MNIIALISNKEPIGGLEIENGFLRFVLLKESKGSLSLVKSVEEKLSGPEADFTNTAFTAKLGRFVNKHNIKYVIISLPSDKIYTKPYSFPATMPDEKIEESMKLAADLQLPRKKEEIYYDWMKIQEDGTNKKIILSYILKSDANPILNAAKQVGLKVVALESRALSLARVIKQSKSEALLVVENGLARPCLSVVVDNHLIFSQETSPMSSASEAEKEIRKISNYHDWFNVNLKKIIFLGKSLKIKKLLLKEHSAESLKIIKGWQANAAYLPSLGAAVRGLIDRKDDEIISLMEIGTEKAYRQERANSTANFFIGLSAALAIFFVGAFLAAWSLMSAIQNNYSRQISAFDLESASGGSTSLQNKAIEFNELIDQAGNLAAQEPMWSKIITEAKNKTVDGIIINNLSLPGAQGVFSVVGVASDREAINRLKKSFESSDIFGGVNIPLDNLGKKTDIPFSLTFTAKNKILIYAK